MTKKSQFKVFKVLILSLTLLVGMTSYLAPANSATTEISVNCLLNSGGNTSGTPVVIPIGDSVLISTTGCRSATVGTENGGSWSYGPAAATQVGGPTGAFDLAEGDKVKFNAGTAEKLVGVTFYPLINSGGGMGPQVYISTTSAPSITTGSNISDRTNVWISLSGKFTINYFNSAISYRATVSADDGIFRRTSIGSCTTPTGFLGNTSGTATSVACIGSPTQLTEFLNALEWQSTTSVTDSEITLQMGPSDQGFFNNHVYQFVPGAITWLDAKNASEAQFFLDSAQTNHQGYLATITSQAENDFVFSLIKSDAWIGGTDKAEYVNPAIGENFNDTELNNKFYWVTGPERGTKFYDRGPIPGVYQNWRGIEPNNSSGVEYFTQFYNSDGRWNDLGTGTTQGYIIEFGGTPSNVVTSSFVSASILASASDIRSITVTPVTSQTLTFGAAPDLSFTSDGFVNSDDWQVNPSCGAYSGATLITANPIPTGSYSIKCGGGTLPSGYEADFSATGSLTVNRASASLTYTGTSGLAAGNTSITLSASISPNVCANSDIKFYVNGTGPASTPYTVTPGGIYEIETRYEGSNCDASSVWAVVVVPNPGDASNGGGNYTFNGAGRINFGYTSQVNKNGQVSGQIIWHGQNGKFKLKGSISGFTKTTSCSVTGAQCGAMVGYGTLLKKNDSDIYETVGTNMPFRVWMADGGTSTTCTTNGKKQGSCSTILKPDWFALDLSGDSYVIGESEALTQLSAGNITIKQ